MLSSVSSVQSSWKIPVKAGVITDPVFSSFPSSLAVRYDLYYDSGRVNASNASVTTNNAHIYKILDKSGNNYHMISKGTDANGANTFKSSGLGLGKPCLYVKYTTPSTMGYTSTTAPAFVNGFELICVIRPTPPTTGTIRQSLINKCKASSSMPNGFDIKFDRTLANGTTSTSWNPSTAQGGALNLYNTYSTAFIMSTRFFKAGTSNIGYGYDRKNGVDIYSTLVPNYGNYADGSVVLSLCCRPDNTISTSYEIGEILMFNTELSVANRELMEGYLATKWGIPITNTAHSYYNKVVTYTGTNP